MRLADAMHDLERKLCSWVESEPDTINHILDVSDQDHDEDAHPDGADGDADGMIADNDDEDEDEDG